MPAHEAGMLPPKRALTPSERARQHARRMRGYDTRRTQMQTPDGFVANSHLSCWPLKALQRLTSKGSRLGLALVAAVIT